MSGRELIEWAVRECQREKIPPYDSAIVNKIRELLDVANPPKREPRP